MAVDLSRASLVEILAYIEGELTRGVATVELDVLDPDRGRGLYAGERVDGLVHRPLRVWVDLAERLGLRLCTPRGVPPPLVRLRLERLERATQANVDDVTEKYGTTSKFARISKLEDPGFVIDLREALERVRLEPGARVLDLGVNRGDELALLLAKSVSVVGIDHSASAIEQARERFASKDVKLFEADVNTLSALELGRFDLVFSIGTLQSPGIDDRELLRRIVQDHLSPTGAVILGVPNCRYVDGEIEFGTRMKNFRQPELGLLIKDVAFYRRYLQQHHRQVFVTGKHYVMVTGVMASPAASTDRP